MVNSYFLSGYERTNLCFASLDCCERMPDSLNKPFLYEVICFKEIENPYLRNPEIIAKYMRAISEFMNVELKTEDLDDDLTKSGLTEYIDKTKYILYRFPFKGLTGKRIVAIHNLIRYLWYTHHNPIVFTVLFLYENPKINMKIEDIFGMAHSFQRSTNRGLVGVNNYDKRGFVYFPENSESLKALQTNEYFNVIYGDRGIEMIINFGIKGNFFEESTEEIYFNSKPSFISIAENNNIEDSNTFKKICNIYIKNREIYDKLVPIQELCVRTTKSRVSFVIETNINNDSVKIDCLIRNMVNGGSNNFTVMNDIDLVIEKLKNIVKI